MEARAADVQDAVLIVMVNLKNVNGMLLRHVYPVYELKHIASMFVEIMDPGQTTSPRQQQAAEACNQCIIPSAMQI
eukprot:1157471-Pelagomonas_calceolata.AAC.10